MSRLNCADLECGNLASPHYVQQWADETDASPLSAKMPLFTPSQAHQRPHPLLTSSVNTVQLNTATNSLSRSYHIHAYMCMRMHMYLHSPPPGDQSTISINIMLC